MKHKTLLTARQAAEITGYSASSLRGFAARHEIPCIKVATRLFFDEAAVRQWIAERTVSRPQIGKGLHHA